MIITAQYIWIFVLAVFLTLFSWALETNWIVQRCGPNRFKTIRNTAVFLLVILLVWLAILNFAATLTAFVFGSGLIALVDLLFCRRKRIQANYPEPLIVENARSFFLILLLVWVIRSFIIQPYRVPTGSLQPTVRPGDFLAVNQFAYGLRFPVTNYKFMDIGEPKRGDIVLFYYPVDPSVVFVKRLVGMPGDYIEYKDKVFYINGKQMTQVDQGSTIDEEPETAHSPQENIPVYLKEENLDGVKHQIYIRSDQPSWIGNFSVTVPKDQYFMVGDNRDNSDDSRTWGFVPKDNLIGKAFGIWMSWDAIHHRIRWERIGEAVK
ncbi:MAG: lepB2 [Gammaproteobacteria bacterium]|jgi:signal peptidase I|nr:lepB2 [Gammaproteobacteria bacterium]